MDIWATYSCNLLVPPGPAGTLAIIVLEGMGPEDSQCLVRELPQGRPSQLHRAMQGRPPETGIERLLLGQRGFNKI